MVIRLVQVYSKVKVRSEPRLFIQVCTINHCAIDTQIKTKIKIKIGGKERNRNTNSPSFIYITLQKHSSSLGSYYPKCHSSNSSICITWELIRNADS